MPESKPIPFRIPDPQKEAELSQAMGVQFQDPSLLRLALTHRSVVLEWTQHRIPDVILQSNERLEFLGDAVLGLITAERLYVDNDSATEGELTRSRVALVRAETLVSWARSLAVQDALYLGTGEAVTASVRDRILSGSMEAIIGAIYLDSGLPAAVTFVSGFLDQQEHVLLKDEGVSNPKGKLQEVVQEHKLDQPDYQIVEESGPDHARVFTVRVVVNNRQIGLGSGRSKREAQQIAARAALDAIELDGALLEEQE